MSNSNPLSTSYNPFSNISTSNPFSNPYFTSPTLSSLLGAIHVVDLLTETWGGGYCVVSDFNGKSSGFRVLTWSKWCGPLTAIYHSNFTSEQYMAMCAGFYGKYVSHDLEE